MSDVAKELIQRFDDFTPGTNNNNHGKSEIHTGTIQHSPYFNDYVAIGEFLNDPDRVVKALWKLEKDLLTLLAERVEGYSASGKSMVFDKVLKATQARGQAFQKFNDGQVTPETHTKNPPQYPARVQEIHGLLDKALRREEKRGGFSSDVTAVWGALTTEQFLSLLRLKKPFKDYGASVFHGEYSHRLQWYCVTRELFHSTTRAAEVYASIAQWFIPKDTKKKQWEAVVLWDALFDRAPNTTFGIESRKDFRSANMLYQAIAWDKQGLEFGKFTPLLQAIMEARFAKRDVPFPLKERAYMAMKLFKQRMDFLSENDNEALKGPMSRAITKLMIG